MATPDQIRRRGRWSLVVGTVLAALALGAVMASACRARDGRARCHGEQRNRRQGATANFTISLSATGNISAAITSAAPSTAKVKTVYSLGATGTLSSSTLSGGLRLRLSSTSPVGHGCGGHVCDGTSTGRRSSTRRRPRVSAHSGHAGRHVFDRPAAKPRERRSLRTASVGRVASSTTQRPRRSLSTLSRRLDSTPPVITPNVSGTLGNNGWYTSNVTVSWTVTEAESPGSLVKTGCVDQNITSDQPATTFSCSATSTGGSAGPVRSRSSVTPPRPQRSRRSRTHRTATTTGTPPRPPGRRMEPTP